MRSPIGFSVVVPSRQFRDADDEIKRCSLHSKRFSWIPRGFVRFPWIPWGFVRFRCLNAQKLYQSEKTEEEGRGEERINRLLSFPPSREDPKNENGNACYAGLNGMRQVQMVVWVVIIWL